MKFGQSNKLGTKIILGLVLVSMLLSTNDKTYFLN